MKPRGGERLDVILEKERDAYLYMRRSSRKKSESKLRTIRRREGRENKLQRDA